MRKFNLAIGTAALLQAFGLAAYAEEADVTYEVTASRFSEPTSSNLAPVTVLTRHDIEIINPKSFTDIARRLPGVEVIRNGGRGQSSSVATRGGSAVDTLVLLDGVKLNSSYSGSVDISTIPVSNIERVEYIRGARATVYGSQATAAVINIITRPEMGEKSGKLAAKYGSFANRSVSGALRLPITENDELKIAGSYEMEHGYNVKPLEGVNDGDRHGFRGHSLMLDYQHLFTPEFLLSLSGHWTRTKAQYDESSYDYFTYLPYEQMSTNWVESYLYTAGLKYSGKKYRSTLDFSFQKTDAYDYVLQTENAWAVPESRNRANTYVPVKTWNVLFANEYTFGESFTLGAGYDFRNDRLDDGARTGGSEIKTDSGDMYNTGAYLLASYDDGTWQAELSGRLDHYEQFGNHGTWQAGFGWRYSPLFRTSLRYGTSFRAPSIMNLYYPYMGNPELDPEKSGSWELLFEGAHKALDWKVTGYRTDYKDRIVYDSARNWLPYNIDKARVEGVEAELNLTTWYFTHQAFAGFKYARNPDSGKEVPNVAKQNLRYNLVFDMDAYDASLSVDYYGDRYSSYQKKLPDYAVWNLSAGWQVTQNLKVTGAVRNLFDRNYESAPGYPEPERNYEIGFELSFGE